MERKDKHTFYLISKLMPSKDTPYLNINDLPIIRKLMITNKENNYGISVDVEARTGICIYDIISSGCLYFIDLEEARSILRIIKYNGFKTAFIVEVDIDANYKTL